MKKDACFNSILVDCIRIFAAWCVLLGHCFGFYQITIFKDETSFFALQNIAVIVFFSLAGFLMVYSIEKMENDISWGQYICHQGKRIYSIYIPALISVIAIDGISILLYPNRYEYYSTYDVRTFLGNLCMLQNIPFKNIIARFGSNRPLWTMAIEWWLYVIMSFFYINFYKRKRINVKSLVLAGPLVIFFVKYIYSGLAVSFMLGMMMFLLYERKKNIRRLYYAVAIGIMLIGGALMGIRYKQAYILPFFVFIPLLLWCILELGRQNINRKNHEILRLYARSTFPLYLLHYPIIELLIKTNISKQYSFLCVIILSNLVAIIFTYFFDIKYFMKKFQKSRCKNDSV